MGGHGGGRPDKMNGGDPRPAAAFPRLHSSCVLTKSLPRRGGRLFCACPREFCRFGEMSGKTRPSALTKSCAGRGIMELGQRRDAMRVIYVDVLAGVNLAMDYLLLAAVARLSGAYCTRPRLLAGAALGAGYAVASCLEGLAWLSLLPVKAIAGAGMVRTAFGARSAAELVRLTALFYLVSCAVAGGALALGRVSDAGLLRGRRILHRRAVPGGRSRGRGRMGAHRPAVSRGRQSAEVQPRASGLCRARRGFFPARGHGQRPERPGERQARARTRPAGRGARAAGGSRGAAGRPAGGQRPAVLAVLPGAYRAQFQLLPYRAVGKESGLLLAFRPERAARDGVPWQGLAAISPERVANGQYEGLIGL